jgi:hypothetical protein
MATYDQRYPASQDAERVSAGNAPRRIHTETGPFSRTSEFWVFVVTALAILVAGSAVSANGDHADVFPADRVWLYVTLLASAYLVSRGIAKAGSHGHDRADDQLDPGRNSAPLGERVKAAAKVLTDGPGDERHARYDERDTVVDTPHVERPL